MASAVGLLVADPATRSACGSLLQRLRPSPTAFSWVVTASPAFWRTPRSAHPADTYVELQRAQSVAVAIERPSAVCARRNNPPPRAWCDRRPLKAPRPPQPLFINTEVPKGLKTAFAFISKLDCRMGVAKGRLEPHFAFRQAAPFPQTKLGLMLSQKPEKAK
jgi:hypothetical protein